MTRNVGNTERLIRAVIGAALLIAAFTALSGLWAWVAGIVGAVMVGTAALGYCPPYQLLGINTNKAG